MLLAAVLRACTAVLASPLTQGGCAWGLTGPQVTAEARRQQRALWHQSPSTDIFPRPVPQHTRRYPGCQAEGDTRAAVMWPNSRHLSYIGACSEFRFCPSQLDCSALLIICAYIFAVLVVCLLPRARDLASTVIALARSCSCRRHAPVVAPSFAHCSKRVPRSSCCCRSTPSLHCCCCTSRSCSCQCHPRASTFGVAGGGDFELVAIVVGVVRWSIVFLAPPRLWHCSTPSAS